MDIAGTGTIVSYYQPKVYGIADVYLDFCKPVKNYWICLTFLQTCH